jgi:hypothetical protein
MIVLPRLIQRRGPQGTPSDEPLEKEPGASSVGVHNRLVGATTRHVMTSAVGPGRYVRCIGVAQYHGAPAGTSRATQAARNRRTRRVSRPDPPFGNFARRAISRVTANRRSGMGHRVHLIERFGTMSR